MLTVTVRRKWATVTMTKHAKRNNIGEDGRQVARKQNKGFKQTEEEAIPVLLDMGRWAMCCVNHAGKSPDCPATSAVTASSRGLRENRAKVESAFKGSSE